MLTPMESTRYVARNRYAWPGGYETVLVMDDGAILCAVCVRENYRLIMESTRDELSDGWTAIGMDHTGNMDAPESGDPSETCAHCGRDILLDM